MMAREERMARLVQVPGRETAAGRALFALCNGFETARKRGNDFSKTNCARLLRLNNCRRIPPPSGNQESKAPPQKARVKVPRFRTRRCKDEPKFDLPVSLRGRKKASQIQEQLKEDLAHPELPPFPTKPLLDDKEKQRLAMLFEWSGRIDKEDLVDRITPSQLRPIKYIKKDSIEEQEMIINQISKEIEDRESFLEDMKRLGCGDEYLNQINFEIQQRVKQMQLLDQLITKEEEERMEARKSAKPK